MELAMRGRTHKKPTSDDHDKDLDDHDKDLDGKY